MTIIHRPYRRIRINTRSSCMRACFMEYTWEQHKNKVHVSELLQNVKVMIAIIDLITYLHIYVYMYVALFN